MSVSSPAGATRRQFLATAAAAPLAYAGIRAGQPGHVDRPAGRQVARPFRPGSRGRHHRRLSDLKPTGKDLKLGVLRRMSSSALPIGAELIIAINGEPLTSSKLDTPASEEWVIGPDLMIDEFDFEEEDDAAPPPAPGGEPATKTTKIPVTASKTPYPSVDLPGIGKVTGRVRLYQQQISKGKSEERGTSNGFHVNVLGRVVNQNDPSFGEENLSHGAWACVRITVRADGLNEFLTTSREQFREQRPLKIFRAFLRKVFNLVRNQYDSDVKAALPHGGDVLVQSLGVVSLNPLRNVVVRRRRHRRSRGEAKGLAGRNI